MKQIVFLMLLAVVPVTASAQKSRVLAVFQMIDAKKYEEAKESIELAVWNDKTSRWHRTYYAKGVLCQTAYEEGYKEKDTKKTGLYPDQLYVAYNAYERALELDVRGRLRTAVSQRYYLLSNDFRRLGVDHFKKRAFEEALQAFEHALLVSNSELINARLDTGLVYNAAIAAYESENWEKAIRYFTGLHDAAHAPGTSILLYLAYMESGDSVRAEQVLVEAEELYKYEEQVVVHLVNLYVRTNRMELAIQVLEDAINYRPENHHFLWGKGLVYRRMGNYEQAIEGFKEAMELAPRDPKIYYHLGVIYYNIGVELREASLNIGENEEYQAMRKQSREKFMEAVTWLEKSYEKDPYDEETISMLHQLYYQLQMREKEETMKLLIR